MKSKPCSVAISTATYERLAAVACARNIPVTTLLEEILESDDQLEAAAKRTPQLMDMRCNISVSAATYKRVRAAAVTCGVPSGQIVEWATAGCKVVAP